MKRLVVKPVWLILVISALASSLTILLAAPAYAPTLIPEFKIQVVHAGPDAQVHEGAQAEFLVTKKRVCPCTA